MDFLKAIFGDKALTYAELEAALKDSKDIKLANLAAGGYVDKGKYEALETRNRTMAEQLKGLESVKPEELQAQIASLTKANEEAEQRYQQALLDHAVESRLMSEGAVDVRAVRALLDMDKVKRDGDSLLGLDEQIAAIKKDKAWAFPSKEKKTPELSGAVPAEPSGGNTEQTADIAMMNSLLGLPN